MGGSTNNGWNKKKLQLLYKAKKKARDVFSLTTPKESVTRQWYDWNSKEWKNQDITIQLDDRPFSEGNMRWAYKLLDWTRSEGKRCHAAKVQKKDPRHYDDSQQYYVDVEMQQCCRALSKAYNENKPPKTVNFVDAFVISRRPTSVVSANLLAVEPYLKGKYKKYNNNYGYVSIDDRNTPHTFTHFTYEYTHGKLMVVDVQGVDDMYTDPQIHTYDARGYGKGNWGKKGMDKFFETHICNMICQYLGLPKHNSALKFNGTAVDPILLKKRHTFKDDFSLLNFSRELKPEKNSAYEEDLALLGIDNEQFNYLVDAFNMYSLDNQGLDWRDLFPMLDNLEFDFSERTVVDVVRYWDRNRDGKITFMEFLLWWTGQVR